jgi:hypothetical protein
VEHAALIYGGFRSMILLFGLDSSLQPAKVRAAQAAAWVRCFMPSLANSVDT